MKKLFTYLSRLVYFALILSLLLSYISVYINPEKVWVLAFFGICFPIFISLNILYLFYWIIRRKKLLFIVSFITILLGWSHISDFAQINFSSNLNEDNTFKFMSYNVRLFNIYDWNNNKSHRDNILSVINKENSDIIAFQEFYIDKTGKFSTTDTLKKLEGIKYSHIVINKKAYNHQFGIATFSKYPIINKGEINFTNTSNLCIYSDIKIDDDTIRVYNNHLESIRFNPENYNFIDSIGFKNEEERINGTKAILRKMKGAYIKRAKQVNIISEHIKSSPYKVIVCGDFNDTPISYTYNTLADNLKDSFKESGNGVGNSYAGLFPSFRIDYILHSKDLNSINYKTIRKDYSDHYPVCCEFIKQ